MRSGYFLIGAMLCVLLVNEVSAQCLCAAKGLDVCSCAAMRPLPKPVLLPPSLALPPAGDSCWCSKQIVKPAIPPKPICKPPPTPCTCCAPAKPSCLDAMLPAGLPPGIPADPLSIAKALANAKAVAVPEAKLSFGPVSTPLNGLKKICISNIPEEKLFALNGLPYELKRKAFPVPSKAELLAEALLEEQEDAQGSPPAPPVLTYEALGYGPAIFKNPIFMKLTASAQRAIPQPLLTGCGYIPGEVAQCEGKYLECPPCPAT